MSNAERLARAVLLFHGSTIWTADDTEMWVALTGSQDATTRTLCNLARWVRREEEDQHEQA
jgi:L-cysteine desulfidase